jgi:hypothetical protein
MEARFPKPDSNVDETHELKVSAPEPNQTFNPMNSESNTLTRREALLCTLKGAVAAAVSVPLMVQAEPPEPTRAEAAFVPENDYPYFGYEPDTRA